MSNKLKGIIYILISAFFFAVMNSFVKASGDLPFMQKSLFRNLISLVISIVLIYKNRKNFKPAFKNLPLLFLRGITGTLGLLCNFYAIDHLILADANMLNKLSPFFAILFSYFILKEKPNKLEIGAVFVAFIGSLFIIKPGLGINNFAALVGLFGGLFAGLAYSLVRLLSKRGVEGYLIVFSFSFVSTLICLPFVIFDYKVMNINQILCLLMAGICGLIAQFAITSAYKFAPAKELSVFDYTQILFAALIGFFVFNQVVDILSLIGYSLVILMALAIFIYENAYLKK